MSRVLEDLWEAARGWSREWGVAAAIVVTLALGLGVNVTVFGLVEALLLRPLPAVPDAERVLVTRRNPFSYPAYLSFADRQRSFASVGAWQSLGVSLYAAGEALPAEAVFVSDGYFQALGVRAQAGRLPGRQEVLGSGPLVAVLSERCWRRRFEASPSVIGREVTINQAPVTIVGVAATGFEGTDLGAPADVFLPVTGFDRVRGATGSRAWLPDEGSSWLRAVARLRPDGADGQAKIAAEQLFLDLGAGIPASREREPALDLVPLTEAAFPPAARDGVRRLLVILAAVAGCVLLVACVNVANLLLARGERRRREWGVRLALGVTRARLARQLLAETLVLVAAASGAALLLAGWALSALSRFRLTAGVPIVLDGVIDARVALAAGAAALVTTAACGLAPAWHGSRTDLSALLVRDGARPAGRSLSGRNAFVAVQVAVAVLLVCGAILFVTTLQRQRALPAGFDTDAVVMVRLNLRPAGYGPAPGAEFYRRLEARAASLPGVVAVARALNEPLGATAYVRTLGVPGGAGEPLQVMNTVVSPGYFRTLGIPLVEGEDFGPRTPAGSVIVNETMARRLWPGRSAVGQAVEARDHGSRMSRVAGVVADSKYQALREDRTAFLYTHAADDYDPVQVVFARAAGEPRAVLAGLRQAVRSLDPRVPILAAGTLGDHVASTLSQPRAAAGLVAALAAIAAALAAIGLHAVLAFAASARRKEMAVRIALGAGPVQVAASVIRRVGVAVGAGLVAGLGAALAAEPYVSSLLFGVGASDPWVLMCAAAATGALAVAAAARPVACAVLAPPAAVLRE